MLRRFTSWLAEWWFEQSWKAIEFEKEAARRLREHDITVILKQMQANRSEWQATSMERIRQDPASDDPNAPIYDAMIAGRVRRDFEPEVLRKMDIVSRECDHERCRVIAGGTKCYQEHFDRDSSVMMIGPGIPESDGKDYSQWGERSLPGLRITTEEYGDF